MERACTHAAGPYNYQNFEIDGWAYYTNNPPAGAFRGFGVTQMCIRDSLWGQVCLKYALLWVVLAGTAIVLFDWMRHWLFQEERPHYRWI